MLKTGTLLMGAFLMYSTSASADEGYDRYMCKLKVWNDANWKCHAGCEIFFDSDGNLDGEWFYPTKDYPLPHSKPLNDRISSFIAETGEWKLCIDASYMNCSKVYSQGEGERNLVGTKFQDSISSVKLLNCNIHNGGVLCKDGKCPGDLYYEVHREF